MLATAHAVRNSALDMFRLALSLIESDEKNIPPSLKQYFAEILEQAKRIAHDPNQVSDKIKPEAIQLAVEIRDIDNFLDDLDRLDGVESVSPAMAKQLLERMEVGSVHQNGFSPFTGFAG